MKYCSRLLQYFIFYAIFEKEVFVYSLNRKVGGYWYMCTPYKIEAFADNSRPGEEASEDGRGIEDIKNGL